MIALKAEVRRSAYYDSVVLMQLQRALATLPGVVDAGVVMGTAANKDLLAQNGLLTAEVEAAAADDLCIVVKATDEAQAQAALAQVDGLLRRRRSDGEQDYRPKSLATATTMLPEAQWVLVSVPGQYAAGVARQALDLNKHVFLYSDNVPVTEEVNLKTTAAAKGLLVMGPDCGTAIVNGVGLGFANRVRRGPIGVVAAAGTGLQTVTSRIHQLGSGITHALGTGGRDLSEQVGAITALQGLDLLARDPETRVIVLISKPPAPRIATRVLQAAQATGKPVVIDFIGYTAETVRRENLHFTRTLDETAALAVELAATATVPSPATPAPPFAPSQRYLRGLYSGGTLAYEALLLLQNELPGVYTNTPLDKAWALANPMQSQEHTIVDLGEDVFTVGRLHPMLDNDLRIRRLRQEAADPEVAVILLDVVLGYGAHPDPASEFAPAIAEAIAMARRQGRHLEVVVTVIGTADDPQDVRRQSEQLRAAGANVFTGHQEAVTYAAGLVRGRTGVSGLPPVTLTALTQPLAALNVGLETFAASLTAQGAAVVHVDWRPAAGGNERLASILAKMRNP